MMLVLWYNRFLFEMINFWPLCFIRQYYINMSYYQKGSSIIYRFLLKISNYEFNSIASKKLCWNCLTMCSSHKWMCYLFEFGVWDGSCYYWFLAKLPSNIEALFYFRITTDMKYRILAHQTYLWFKHVFSISALIKSS